MIRYKNHLLIIIISFIPFLPVLLRPELPHTHDGLVHLPRMAAFYKALLSGHIPVRWAGELNYGYGMPLFNFVYHMPYIIASFFLFFGSGLVFAFKLTLLVSYILSGLGMYLFAKTFFEDEKKGFLCAVFYQFATFRFVELFIRGSFGEVYTYSFLPFILYSLLQLQRYRSLRYFLHSVFFTACLILSHNSVSLIFFGISFLFILLFIKNFRDKIISFLSLFAGLLLSLYYWLPALAEHKYTYGNLFMKDLYLEHFAPIHQFFLPNFINSSALQTGGISVQIGFLHVFALLLALFPVLLQDIPVVKKNTIKLLRLFVGVLTGIALFFMLPVSKIVWGEISILRQFQFPWRFLSVIVFSSSLASFFLFSIPFIKKKNFYLGTIFLVVITSIWYWNPSLGFEKVNESYYWNFPLNTTYYGETDVIWSAGPAKSYPKKRIEIISGKGTVNDFIKENHCQTFTVNAKTDLSILSHTQYFPGWEVSIDGIRHTNAVQFQDPNHRGEIVFSVPKGKHAVRLQFTETKIRYIADSISAVIFSLFVLFLVFHKHLEKRFSKLYGK